MVTAAVFFLFFLGLVKNITVNFLAETPSLLRLLGIMALLAGVPTIMIGIISLLFRKGVRSDADVLLIILIDIVLSISMAVNSAKGFWGFIGYLIIFLIVSSISAIPGLIMTLVEGRLLTEEEAQKTATRMKWQVILIVVAVLLFVGYCVYNSQKNSVTIPDGVTVIGEGEFARKQLVNVDIPNSVTSIEKNAFRRNKLTSVEIPDSVISIGDSAFFGNHLTSIAIGANVTLGNIAFGSGFKVAYNGMGAGTYTRPNTRSEEWSVWHGDFKYQYYNGDIIITDYNGTGGAVVIPAEINGNPVNIIGKEAFFANNFTRVIIPDSVTVIEEMAFFGDWDEVKGLFDEVKNVPLGTISSVTIGKNVTTIGNRVFENNSLSSISIPNSVTSIGYSAFADNPVTSVRIGENVKLGVNETIVYDLIIGKQKVGKRKVNGGVLGYGTGFNTAYTNNGNKAGTYTRPDTDSTTWTWKE